MLSIERVTIIQTRHIELHKNPRETPASDLDADLVDAVEQGRITLRRARATQAGRAGASETP